MSRTIIDGHAHLFGFNKEYVRRDIDICHKHHIQRLAILGLPKAKNVDEGDNEAVLAAAKYAPDFFIPFFYVNPDKDKPSVIAKALKQGFAGFKFISTHRAYSDHAYFPLYKEIEKTGRPTFFHTGYLMNSAKHSHVHLDHCRPVHLDHIARAFPDMKMIAAHMGNPWWEEACLVAWKHKNIYTEFSGGSAFKRDMGYWLQLLKPNGQIHPTVNKLILAQDSFFLGKDIPFDPRPSVLDFYDRFYKAMGLNKEQREAIDYKNFEKLLGE